MRSRAKTWSHDSVAVSLGCRCVDIGCVLSISTLCIFREVATNAKQREEAMAVLTEVGAQGGCSKSQGNTLIMLAPKVGQAAASIPRNPQGLTAAGSCQ